MAGKAVALHGLSIALACCTFEVSETCYRYSAKLNDENEEIADLLIRLTRAKRAGASACAFFTCAMSGDIAGTTSASTTSTTIWS